MGPGQSIKTCFSKFADFNGRARRSELWWFYLFAFVVQIVFYTLAATVAPILGIVALIAAFAFMVPQLAVGCRRLHDRDMSGWWQLLLIVPLGFIVLFVLWALKGTEGDNKFGAPTHANRVEHA